MATRTRESRSRQFKAVVCMVLATIGFALLPLTIDKFLKHNDAFLFAAVVTIGEAVGVFLFLVLRNRRELADMRLLTAVRSKLLDWSIMLGVINCFDWAFLAWSTQFVDTAVSAIVYQMWPVLFVIFIARFDKASGEGEKYRTLSVELFILMVFAFLGLAFVVLAPSGSVAGLISAGRSELIGIALALLAALTGALWAFNFKWGEDLRGVLSKAKLNVGSDSLTGVLLGYSIVATCAAVMMAGIGLARGGRISLLTFTIALGLGLVVNAPSAILHRKSNVLTDNWGINAIPYGGPVIALLLLAVFSEIVPSRPDFVWIGACGIVVANLLINLDAEQRQDGRVRWGFKSLIISMWLYGTWLYLRDEIVGCAFLEWGGSEYWGVVALSSTIFILILSFRISRLDARTQSEDDIAVAILQSIRELGRKSDLDLELIESLRRHFAGIDTAPRAEILKENYEHLLDTCEALESELSATELAQLDDMRVRIDQLVQSRQHGYGFGELVALVVFGMTTVILTLVARPQLTDSAAFLSESFAMLFAATITFLLFNLIDVARERTAEVAAIGATRSSVSFRLRRTPIVEQMVSIGVALGIGVTLVLLLHDKWSEPLCAVADVIG